MIQLLGLSVHWLFVFSLPITATKFSGHILIPILICHYHPSIFAIISCCPKASSFLLVLQELQQSSNSSHHRGPFRQPYFFSYCLLPDPDSILPSRPFLPSLQSKISLQSLSFESTQNSYVPLPFLCTQLAKLGSYKIQLSTYSVKFNMTGENHADMLSNFTLNEWSLNLKWALNAAQQSCYISIEHPALHQRLMPVSHPYSQLVAWFPVSVRK